MALKIVLAGSLAQVGLALATAAGAWVNLLLVVWFSVRAGHLSIDATMKRAAIKFAAAGGVVAVALWLTARMARHALAGTQTLRDELALAILIGAGTVVYVGAVIVLFGVKWLKGIARS